MKPAAAHRYSTKNTRQSKSYTGWTPIRGSLSVADEQVPAETWPRWNQPVSDREFGRTCYEETRILGARCLTAVGLSMLPHLSRFWTSSCNLKRTVLAGWGLRRKRWRCHGRSNWRQLRSCPQPSLDSVSRVRQIWWALNAIGAGRWQTAWRPQTTDFICSVINSSNGNFSFSKRLLISVSEFSAAQNWYYSCTCSLDPKAISLVPNLYTLATPME